MKKDLVKKCPGMFAKVAEKKDDCKKLHEQFGKEFDGKVHDDGGPGH